MNMKICWKKYWTSYEGGDGGGASGGAGSYTYRTAGNDGTGVLIIRNVRS